MSAASAILSWPAAKDLPRTIVRAHQRAAGARQQRGPDREPVDHALGRSCGGPTAKIHLAADGNCRPLAFVLTPGQAGDAPASAQVMTRLRVPRSIGQEPAIRCPGRQGLLVPRDRDHLRRRGVGAVIPRSSDQIARRKKTGRSGGRPPAFVREAHKRRSTVERSIDTFKQWRGLVATTRPPPSASPPSSSGQRDHLKETA
ncbi:transposase [Streptomyces sp. ID05-04B]|uniref:transposase n=1 Tax=Streptomyces sp. ID05-04B TaxID=3028661 RepID=UPI0039F74320